MATDQNEPKTGIIAGIALFAVGTLVALQYVFSSYFAHVSEAVVQQNIAARPGANGLVQSNKAAWTKSLEEGRPMPIERAISGIAQQGRDSFPQIAEVPSEDRAALDGWTPIQKDGHRYRLTVAPDAPPPPPVVELSPLNGAPVEPVSAPNAPSGGTY